MEGRGVGKVLDAAEQVCKSTYLSERERAERRLKVLFEVWIGGIMEGGGGLLWSLKLVARKKQRSEEMTPWRSQRIKHSLGEEALRRDIRKKPQREE